MFSESSDPSREPESRWVDRLREPAAWPHPVNTVRLIETHISWVLLAAPCAYKIKKPVNLGFLDFSTLARRRRFCEEELRLNRRLAPSLYLGVVPVTGSPDSPHVEGTGAAFEYAVKMRAFPQEAQLDRMLADGRLTPDIIDAVARRLARFHLHEAAPAPPGSDFGSPASVAAPIHQTLDQLAETLGPGPDRDTLAAVRAWCERELRRVRAVLEHRAGNGHVRECHGDLHLRNLAWVDGQAIAFDAIEFSETLRWIDTMSDIAFLYMDLEARGHPELAARLMLVYLEETGDYPGIAVLRLYLVYRALVRAKVDALRALQPDLAAGERGALWTEGRRYLELARRYAAPPRPVLFITHGLSGSGKTTAAGAVALCWPALRVRSDVERKRLAGLAAHASSGSGPGTGLYRPEMTRRTYARLWRAAATALAAGFSIVADASFLAAGWRRRFQRLARRRGAAFLILDCQAPLEELAARIHRRRQHGRDASEATLEVLHRQRRTADPLTRSERRYCLTVGNEAPSRERLAQALRAADPLTTAT